MRKNFYICWSAGRSPRVHEVNPGRDPSIYVIEVNLCTSASWILDTRCGSHICVNVQGLRSSRSLVKGEVDLRVGNGARVAALAVGFYDLYLPNGLIFQLNNCYYVPTVSRNIISVSCLDLDGFHFIIKNNIFLYL